MSTGDLCFDIGAVEQFQPHAKYHHGLDMVVYLAEDCSYTSEPVDGFLTIFWNPSRDRLVGVKLKGFRYLFHRLKAKHKWSDDMFLPLVQVIEATLESGLAENIMQEQERMQKYALAKKLTRQIGLDPEQVRKIAQVA